MFKSAANSHSGLPPTTVKALAVLSAAVRRLEWTDEAACRDEDPELFFPEGTTGPALSQAARARQVCQSCPVRTPCLAFALEQSLGFGIWGGSTANERLAIGRLVARHRP